ncbi:MAG TPA: hypothetical protein VFR32_03135 [Gaiellaceae bacterium]|nr:hypothetical protein [Gaiellaceae bacterium]
MLRKLRLPSPAMAVALLALFAGFTGSAIAQNVVPLAKRALTADKAKVATTARNAQRLQGRTATQIAATPGPATDAATLNGQTAAQIAATPGPASSIPAGAITYRTQSWSLQSEDELARDTALCQSNERVIGGGWDQASGIGYVLRDQPLPDGSGWRVHVFAESGNDLPAQGTMWAVCLRVS